MGARQDALARTEYSPFLSASLSRYPDVGDVFLAGGADAACRQASLVTNADSIRARLRRERTRLATALALGDLAGELSFSDVTGKLSKFADTACELALAEASRTCCPGLASPLSGIVILALGKHGGRELNYSSDIDPIVIYDAATLPRISRRTPQQTADAIARAFVDLLQTRDPDGYVFRVDLRLRPAAEVAPLAVPFEGAVSHYEGAALPWERAAFVRARIVAGDRQLGAQFLEAIKPFVWRRSLDFGVFGELAQIAQRIRRQCGGATACPGGDLKRGRGGIREVEFFVQAHQLTYGGRNPKLRSPNLLEALASLERAGVVDHQTAQLLARDYQLLRTIEHRLQMVDDRQTHSLPAGRALQDVAMLHGMGDAGVLLAKVKEASDRVARLFDRFQPDQRGTTASIDALVNTEQRVEAERLVEGWRAGSAPALRSSAAQAALEDVLPTLLASFAESDEPLVALYRFDDVVRRSSGAVNLFRMLEANRPITRLLADTIASSPTLATMLAERPELLDRLLDASALDPQPPLERLEAQWWPELSGMNHEGALNHLRLLVSEERFALGVRFTAMTASPAQLSRDHADVAEVAVRLAHRLAVRDFQKTYGVIDGASLAVVAMGRFGGRALTHASDLDLILLHNGESGQRSTSDPSHEAPVYFGRLGQRVVAALSVPTSAGPLYQVDTRLRPSGRRGATVPSVSSFGDYGLHGAHVWERMSLTRARVVSATTILREQVESALKRVNAPRGDDDLIRAEALAMRRRIGLSKPATGPLDVKFMAGGLVDLEFVVQVERLTSGRGDSPALQPALEDLVEAGRVHADLPAAARLLADALFVLRLTAPDGHFRSAAAAARTHSALELADQAQFREALASACRAVTRQWNRTFQIRSDDRESWNSEPCPSIRINSSRRQTDRTQH